MTTDQSTNGVLRRYDYEEEAIVSFIIDFPNFFVAVEPFIDIKMFDKPEVQLIVACIKNAYEKHGHIPTRKLLHNHIARKLSVDDPYEDILRIVDRKSDPRDVPFIKDKLTEWAEHKAFGLLYDPETMEAYQNGDYDRIKQVIKNAEKIRGAGQFTGLWFFRDIEKLFDENQVIHYKTGFHRLDNIINEGGPSPGEVLCWMAATNVGKSIMLANNAVNSIKQGLNTLFVSFELSALRTAFRCVGALSGIDLKDRVAKKEKIVDKAGRIFNTHKAELVLYELPPDECSVNHIYAIVEGLKRSDGWLPNVICLDYLELMKSREPDYNRKDYERQKHVATETRGLGKNTNSLIYTATQGNRSTSGADNLIDINQMAESYGKAMPLPYVISINQSDTEREQSPPQMRLYIAKNTNGPKHDIVSCTINYNNMLVREAI